MVSDIIHIIKSSLRPSVIFLKFISRDWDSTSGGVAEREGDRQSQAGSTLSATQSRGGRVLELTKQWDCDLSWNQESDRCLTDRATQTPRSSIIFKSVKRSWDQNIWEPLFFGMTLRICGWGGLEDKVIGSKKVKELRVHGIGRIIVVDVQITKM